jgi:CheY-like chemotaxis protein
MTQPLALVLYEKLLPGSQLVNRLHDLKYRVQVVADADSLVQCARQDKPMLVLVDLVSTRNDVSAAISSLRRNPDTGHIPIIAFAPESALAQHGTAREAGATMVVGENGILAHLAQFIDQALQLE